MTYSYGIKHATPKSRTKSGSRQGEMRDFHAFCVNFTHPASGLAAAAAVHV